MNYLRNIRKASIGKRILISWVITAVIFFIAGFGAGSLGNESYYKQPDSETQKKILIFEHPDGKIFNSEMSVNWAGENLNFIPLNVPMNNDLQEFVFYLSAAYEIDFTFVMALIQKESNYNSNAVSITDDYGLMQINQCNHAYIKEQLGITDFTEPYDNVRAGMFILRKLFEKYKTPEKVLMAYSMGENGASRLWGQGVFESNYSKSVLEIQRKLSAELERSSNYD